MRFTLTVFAVAVVAAMPASVTRDPAFDHDTWWHLRVGQLVADTGEAPQYDPFSRLGGEQPTAWLAYSWQYERGLFAAYSVLGPAGVLWARAVLGAVSTGVLLMLLTRVPAGRVTWVAAVLTSLVLMPMMRERPWHLTIALTVTTAMLVSELRYGVPGGQAGPTYFLLPMTFVGWANVHIQFVLGWVILGLACVFPGHADRRKLVPLTAACVVATFANPYHVRLLGVVWDYATQTGPLRGVQELAPPDFTRQWTWYGLALVGLAGWVAATRRPVDWFHVALVVVALVFMLRMRRDVWLAAVAAAVVIPDPGVPSPFSRVNAAVLTAVAAVFVAVRVLSSADVDAANAERYPVRAVEYVREHRPAGPLFNPFSWGGYLIWALPEYPVSIDGRTNLYGSERVTRAMATWAGEPGWDADPDLTSARLVIAPRRWILTDLLRGRDADWRVAYEDDVAVVFVAIR